MREIITNANVAFTVSILPKHFISCLCIAILHHCIACMMTFPTRNASYVSSATFFQSRWECWCGAVQWCCGGWCGGRGGVGGGGGDGYNVV